LLIMSVASAIDLEQLQHELQSARGAFDKWALNTVSAADQLRGSHTKNVSELRGAHAVVFKAVLMPDNKKTCFGEIRRHRITKAAPTRAQHRGRKLEAA